MRRRRLRSRSAIAGLQTGLAFQRLGVQWVQMMTASQSVIAHRLSRANTPAQIFEMGSEKAEAALRASQALTRHLARPVPPTLPGALNAWAAMMAAAMRPFHSRAMQNFRGTRGAPRT